MKDDDYEKLLHIVDELMEFLRHTKDERVASLLKLLARNIELYETQRYPLKPLSPVEILKYLMEQHHLNQSDLPEIGGQGVASEILQGKRSLNIRQIKALAKRFHVAPNTFSSPSI